MNTTINNLSAVNKEDIKVNTSSSVIFTAVQNISNVKNVVEVEQQTSVINNVTTIKVDSNTADKVDITVQNSTVNVDKMIIKVENSSINKGKNILTEKNTTSVNKIVIIVDKESNVNGKIINGNNSSIDTKKSPNFQTSSVNKMTINIDNSTIKKWNVTMKNKNNITTVVNKNITIAENVSAIKR